MGWDPMDQDYALAFERAHAEVCPQCGTRDEDWIDPETGRPLDPPRFEPVMVADTGCQEIARLRRWAGDEYEDDELEGVRFVLAPFDPDRPVPGT